MQKYIITSYIPSEDIGIHDKFFASLKGFCKVNAANLIILRTKSNYVHEELDTRFSEYMIEDNIKLNGNLTVLNMPLNPNVSDPLSGLDSLCSKEGNLVLGFPRQRFRTVPRSLKISSMPKGMWCTGTISKPNYKDSKSGLAMRQAHVYGALIVEVIDDKYFNIRQIQSNSDGSFYDLNKLYKSDGKVDKVDSVEAIVLGDSHPIFADQEVKAETYELIKKLKPKNIVYHDVFDATTISHHVEGKYITKSIIQKDFVSLDHEAKITADYLADFERIAPKANHVVVKSNHDEHLDRYLDEFRFKADYPNLITALELARQMVLFKRKQTETGPLEYLLKKYRDLKTFTFLERDSSYKIKGIECANHGDAGANGARGSSKSIGIMTSGASITGHCLTDRHSVNTKDRGWINIKDVIIGDTVLSYNATTKCNEWVSVTDTLATKYTGEMLEIGHNLWKQDVTSNHHMFLTDGTYINVKDAINCRFVGEVPIAALEVDPTNTLHVDKNYLQLVVAISADSYISPDYDFTFEFRKERKINRLEYILNELMCPYSKAVNSRGNTKIRLKRNSIISERLKCDFKPGNLKHLPMWIRDLHNLDKMIVINELAHWDGTLKNGTKPKQFSTSKLIEANLVQSIVNEMGFRTSLITKNTLKFGTSYVVTFCLTRRPISIEPSRRQLVPWRVNSRQVENLDVYCITTPLMNFWVRNEDGGQVSLTGNTHSPQIGILNDYCVGTSTTLQMPYTDASGGSGWLNSHVIIYPSGARTHIHIIKRSK